MKSLSILNPYQITACEIPRPTINKDEVLIKVRYVGFCGSDLSSYRGANPLVSYPRIPGHEVTGDIVEKGVDVPETLRINQKATVIPYSNCGECASCRRYRFNACKFNKTLGVQRDGAMAEYIAVPWRSVLVDDQLSYEELVLVEPLTVGFHAVERGRVIDSDRVLILGCGLIGMGALLGAVGRGAEVIVVDFDAKKLNLAKSLGAGDVINASEVNIDEYLQSRYDDKIDVVIEASGSNSAFLTAVKTVSFTGRVVCIGYTNQEVLFATKIAIQKELDVMGSRNATPLDFARVISFMKQYRLPIDQLINRRTDFHNAVSAVESWHANPNDVLKMVLVVD